MPLDAVPVEHLSCPDVRFLLPGTTGNFRCGGLQVELQTARIVSTFASVELVTYRQRESRYPFLDDLLESPETAKNQNLSHCLWVVSWGFDVPHLLRKLQGRRTLYHAHSTGYGFKVPSSVPILAVSRNTLGYWGDRASNNPLLYVPNALESQWLERGHRAQVKMRTCDVLVQARKNSNYVLNVLVPALKERGLRVTVQSGWVEDLVSVFNQSKVVIYDTAEYWHSRGLTEGFGLPPLEALACGCVVFSSLNHALADMIDPGFCGHQIGMGSLDADLDRIIEAVNAPHDWTADPIALEALLETHSEASLRRRWSHALRVVNNHWDHQERALVPLPRSRSLRQLLSSFKYGLYSSLRKLRYRISTVF